MPAKSSRTLCDPMDYSPPGSSCPWDSPGKNTGVGCRALLQGIFPTQGSNPCLLHLLHWNTHRCFPGGSDGEALPAFDLGSIPGLGRFHGGGNCNSFQYSGLENSMDRGAWQAIQSMGSKRVKRLSLFLYHQRHLGSPLKTYMDMFFNSNKSSLVLCSWALHRKSLPQSVSSTLPSSHLRNSLDGNGRHPGGGPLGELLGCLHVTRWLVCLEAHDRKEGCWTRVGKLRLHGKSLQGPALLPDTSQHRWQERETGDPVSRFRE